MEEQVKAECYSGYTYAQEPRAFTWQQRRYKVDKVVRRWRTPNSVCFRVLTAEGDAFSLRYDETDDAWYLRTPSRSKRRL